MRSFKSTLIFSLLLSLIWLSCSNDMDINPPLLNYEYLGSEVAVLNVCGENVNNGLLVSGGQYLNFRIICKDDEALSQLKMDIHNNFDCHGHGSVVIPPFPSPLVDNQTEDLNNQTIYKLSGRDTSFILNIFIPDNVTSGNYHVGFQLIDISGNAAESIFLDSKIMNPSDTVPPRIRITNENSIPQKMKRGETLIVKGEMSDNRPLGSGGNGVVFLNYTNLVSGNSFSTDSYLTMGSEQQMDTTFTFNYVVPSFLVKGDYKFSIVGVDGVRNISEPKEFIITLE